MSKKNLQKITEDIITKEVAKKNKKRLPIAQEILEIIAKNKLNMQASTFDEIQRDYSETYQEIMTKLLEYKDLDMSDIEQIIKFVEAPIVIINNFIVQRMSEFQTKAICDALGVDDLKKLTLQNLDNMLKLNKEDKN